MNRQLAAATIAPAALVAGGWWFGVWQQRHDEVAALDERTSALEVRSQRQRVELAAAQKFVANGDEASARLEEQRAALPTGPDIGGFVAQNEAAAAAAGVVVTSLNPDLPDAKPEPAPAGLKATGVDLTVAGAAAQVASYVDGLMHLPRAVIIDRFDTTGGSTSSTTLTLRIRIFHRVSH